MNIETKPNFFTIHQGPELNHPSTRKRFAPTMAGTRILPGQIVSLRFNDTSRRHEWSLGFADDVSVGLPFVALQDSADADLTETKLLVALSLGSLFEVSTPFFKTGDIYNVGTLLTHDGSTGNVKSTAEFSGAKILGIVTRRHDLKASSLSAPDSDPLKASEFITFQTGEDVSYALRTFNL